MAISVNGHVIPQSLIRVSVALLLSALLSAGTIEEVDQLSAKAFNKTIPSVGNLRQRANSQRENISVDIVWHGDRVGKPGGYGGSSPGADEMRAKTCYADLVIIGSADPDSHSAFSEDGFTIFTVRRFVMDRVLIRSTSLKIDISSAVNVATLG